MCLVSSGEFGNSSPNSIPNWLMKVLSRTHLRVCQLFLHLFALLLSACRHPRSHPLCIICSFYCLAKIARFYSIWPISSVEQGQPIQLANAGRVLQSDRTPSASKQARQARGWTGRLLLARQTNSPRRKLIEVRVGVGAKFTFTQTGPFRQVRWRCRDSGRGAPSRCA